MLPGDGRCGCRLDRNGIQNVRIVQKGCPTARNGSQLVWFCKYAANIQHFNKLCVFETPNLALTSKLTKMMFFCVINAFYVDILGEFSLNITLKFIKNQFFVTDV